MFNLHSLHEQHERLWWVMVFAVGLALVLFLASTLSAWVY